MAWPGAGPEKAGAGAWGRAGMVGHFMLPQEARALATQSPDLFDPGHKVRPLFSPLGSAIASAHVLSLVFFLYSKYFNI